ncbi:acyl carrier protein [Nocardiopsis xinjiangensis]|uniref:acyl carrier protein n=1 Tax=Nocardiopsis xinjiangensis TaxID=124285 RepID=UPI000A073F48|nr:acyl carrier protein [Nocardiopsis xinjiangensis]
MRIPLVGTSESEPCVQEQIRAVMKEFSKLSGVAGDISEDADLWEAGMDSITSVQLLLRLEERFQTELPDSVLTRETFRSIGSLTEALSAQVDQKGSRAS